jgi:hypothetical protein
MIDLELFFKEKPVPEWFKTHAIFKDSDIKGVHKIFPTIGLTNFEIDSNLETSNASTLIKNLCYGLNTYINSAHYYFTTNVNYKHPGLSAKKRDEKYAPAVTLLKQLSAQLIKQQPFVTQFSTKQGLYLTADIVDVDKKTFAKENESLFKVYTKLAEFLRKHYNYTLAALDSIPAFKEYSSHNVNGKMKIVFSSDGLDGAWDILTMSMRGIQSCQAWTGQYAKCTIGSLLDPFTGIIYLTSGSKTEYGTKMIRRCVVRFVVDSMIKRPCIFLEYMYPGEHAATMKAFKDAIRSKVGDRFPIVDQRNSSSSRYYVPYSQTTSLLVKHSNKDYVNTRGSHNQYGILPYRDTFMEYRIKEEQTVLPEQLESIKVTNLTKLGDMFAEHTNISDTYINLIKETIATEVFTKIDAADCKDQTQYTRKACINYFSNKLKISKTLLEKIQSTMKENKDKSIFIPGVSNYNATELASATKRGKTKISKVIAATAKKSKAKTKAVVAEVIPKVNDTISATVDSQIVPVISQIFKGTWEAIAAAKLAKSKAKAKKRIAIR